MQGKLKTFRTGSQSAKILAYLQTGNSLTCLESMQLGLSHNLRSRVSNLKEAGYNIVSEMVKTNTGFVAKYRLSK